MVKIWGSSITRYSSCDKFEIRIVISLLYHDRHDTFHRGKSWVSCPIREIAVCTCAGNAENVFPANAGKRAWHNSRHVRDARAVMHGGIANKRFPLKSVTGENVPDIPGACATHNFMYLVRGTWNNGIRCMPFYALVMLYGSIWQYRKVFGQFDNVSS